MNQQTIHEILLKSVEALFAHQPNIFEFTSETHQTEWNLAHHLANEIHKFLPELDCDLDVVKIHFNSRRPDIIFHKRGSQKDNFLVVETKRDGSTVEIQEDIAKIRSYWFANPLRYQFGAVVNLTSDKGCQVEVFQGPDK